MWALVPSSSITLQGTPEAAGLSHNGVYICRHGCENSRKREVGWGSPHWAIGLLAWAAEDGLQGPRRELSQVAEDGQQGWGQAPVPGHSNASLGERRTAT